MGVIYKGLNFDGVNSLDYGIYITGEGVYNAPTRDVEAIEVPGRNGELILDKGRFSNISVTYKAGTFAQSQAEFAEKLSEFRNAILSRVGYKRLEDDYHPDEYRIAIYTNGLEVGPVHYSEAGEFELTFNCKPQRFLKSGETAQTVGEWGPIKTVSGSIATFEAEANTAIKSLVANIVPKQSGSGDPSPSNVRPISGWSGVKVEQRGKNLCNLVYGNKAPSISSGQMVSVNGWSTEFIKIDTSKNYVLSLGGNISRYVLFYDKNQAYISGLGDFTNGYRLNSFASWANVGYVKLRTDEAESASPQIQLELGTTPTAYEPYQGSSHSISFPSTVYGGEVSVIDGEGKSTMGMVDLGSLSWARYTGTVSAFRASLNGTKIYQTYESPNLVSSQYIVGVTANSQSNVLVTLPDNTMTMHSNYALIFIRDDRFDNASDFKTAMNGVQLVYELATPQTYQLTPEQIDTLLGVNNIWADSGEVSVEYGDDPNDAYNPTPFEAHPLIEAHGYGAINMSGRNITLAQGQPVGDVVLWNGAISSSNSLVEIPLKPTLFGSGDTFYLSAVMGFNANLDNVSFTNNTQVVSATSSSADFTVNNGSFVFGSSSMAFDVLANDIEFVVGTAKQIDVTFTIDTTAPIRTFYAYLTINYEPDNNRIRIFGTFEHNKFSIEGSCEGYSTYIPDTATYIDCEMGEAYYIEDGAIVSANNSVSLPAILPELKTGNNDITYDDTITELKITPRWWKI